MGHKTRTGCKENQKVRVKLAGEKKSLKHVKECDTCYRIQPKNSKHEQ